MNVMIEQPITTASGQVYSVRVLFVGMWAIFMSYFEPIGYNIILLVGFFTANIFIGLIEGIIVNHERFDYKKILWAFSLLLIFAMITLASTMTAILIHKQNYVEPMLDFLSMLYIYSYAVNILHNLMSIFPNVMIFKYLYYVLSVEFIRKIPFFNKFKESENKTENQKL